MMTENKEKKSKIIDISKALCIIAVVLGHSCPFSSFFYLFHLQVFFYINALLLNTSYPIKIFILKRIKSLYLPYVIIMFIVSLLFNFKGFFSIKYIIKIFCFDGAVPGLGAMWFIPCLFINMMIAYFLYKYINKKWWITVCFTIFIFLSYFVFTYNLKFYYNLQLVPYIQIIYCLAMFFSKEEILKVINKYLFFIFFASLLFLFSIYIFSNIRIDLVNNVLINPLYWVVLLLIGIGFIFSLSILISKINIIAKVFVIIGQSSFYIMCFHFIVFSFVNYFIAILINDPDNQMLFNYSVCYKKYWLFYALLGIFIPTLMMYAKKRIIKCIN